MSEDGDPLPNVWPGITAEDQKRADERVPCLIRTRAVLKFVSAEPMIGRVSFVDTHGTWLSSPESSYPGIDWVIIGAESGPGRRPCKLEWVRDLVQQCQAAKVPVFVKQLDIDGKISKNPEEWPEDLRVRQYPMAKRVIQLSPFADLPMTDIQKHALGEIADNLNTEIERKTMTPKQALQVVERLADMLREEIRCTTAR
jgi:hypothetical protein